MTVADSRVVAREVYPEFADVDQAFRDAHGAHMTAAACLLSEFSLGANWLYSPEKAVASYGEPFPGAAPLNAPALGEQAPTDSDAGGGFEFENESQSTHAAMMSQAQMTVNSDMEAIWNAADRSGRQAKDT